MIRAGWFVLGFLAASVIHVIIGTTPDKAIDNLRSWHIVAVHAVEWRRRE